MPLVLADRLVDDITVVACTGRIVEGDESAALDTHVINLLPVRPDIVINLGAVDFVDSAGLGLLVKLASRARARNGSLKLCALGAHIREVLRVTKLDRLLDTYATEADGIAAFYSASHSVGASTSFAVDILCVHSSSDVLAYVREVLKQSGYGVATATNLSDAAILYRATRPSLVVLASELQSSRAEPFDSRLFDPTRLVRLPSGFSTDDPGESAAQLLTEVAGAIGSRQC
jgi:anti-sigma B factor antagonist